MNTKEVTPYVPVDLDMLSPQERANLILTTPDPEYIDSIKMAFDRVLKGQPELRQALYGVARQNVRYRRSLAPDELLPDLPSLRLGDKVISGLVEILKTTNDVKVVDFIEEWTEARLRRIPEMREGLYAIAKQGIAYRLCAQLNETVS